jgi:hypothetical protein
MSCIFKYEGKTFESELALDDYLMVNKRFEKLTKGIPDIVFSFASQVQKNIAGTIFNANEKARGIKVTKNPISFTQNDDNSLEENIEDGYIDNNSSDDSIGVSDFLHNLRKEGVVVTNPKDNKGRIFPVYDADAYWDEVFKAYRAGQGIPEN